MDDLDEIAAKGIVTWKVGRTSLFNQAVAPDISSNRNKLCSQAKAAYTINESTKIKTRARRRGIKAAGIANFPIQFPNAGAGMPAMPSPPTPSLLRLPLRLLAFRLLLQEGVKRSLHLHHLAHHQRDSLAWRFGHSPS
jgi:hypothetical protein